MDYGITHDFAEIVAKTSNHTNPAYMEAVKDMNAGNDKATAGVKTMLKGIEKLSAQPGTKDARISASKGNLNAFKGYESIQTTMKFLIKHMGTAQIMKDLQTIHNKLMEFKPLYVEAYQKNVRLGILEYENAVYLLVTGLTTTMCANISIAQQNDTIRVNKKSDSTMSLIADTAADYAKQLSAAGHKDYLDAILKNADEVKIRPRTEATYLEASIADTIDLIDAIFRNVGAIGHYTVRAVKAIKNSLFGIVPLIRTVLYLRYKKKADTILSLEQQAQFIQQNIEQLQNRKNMDPKEKALIIKRQQAYVTSYLKKAEKLRAELCETEKAAAQGIKEAPTSDEDGELVLESTEVLPDDFFTERHHLFLGNKHKKGNPKEVDGRRLNANSVKLFGRMSSRVAKGNGLSPEDKEKVDRIVAEVKKQSKRESIDLTLEKQIDREEDEKSYLMKSKIGGVPYWPEGMEWPATKGRSGMIPLTMVAQINFSDMPKLKGYPTSGILQFFIADSDIFDVSDDSIRVIYHTDLKKKQSAEIPITTYEDDWGGYPPFTKCFPVKGELQEVYVNMACDDWDDYLDPIVKKEFGCTFMYLYKQNPPAEHAIYDELHKTGSYYGHRIGGYPYFTQSDVRSDEFSELLLQIDSDSVPGGSGRNQGIMWGDCGVANFFIGKEKLARKDFSKVYFTWDCY